MSTKPGPTYRWNYKSARVLSLRGAITWRVICRRCVALCTAVDERTGGYRALVLNGDAMQRERRL